MSTFLLRADKAQRYLSVARHMAKELSKDRSTQVGALFLHPTDFTILAMGYNGLPRGCRDEVPERHQRPLKYDYFEHAERNTIYNACREIFRGASACVDRMPDLSCVRALISVGVSSLFILGTISKEDHRQALELLEEAGVSVSSGSLEDHLEGRDLPLPAVLVELRHHQRLNPDAEAAVIQLSNGRLIHAVRSQTSDSIAPVRQLIYAQARPLLQGSVAVVTLRPCIECSAALLAVGVREVVCPPVPDTLRERWDWDLKATLTASGVSLQELDI